MGQSRTAGPAAKRYWRVVWIILFGSITIGEFLALSLNLSPFVTIVPIALLLILATLPLALAARRERIEQERFERDGGQP
jgi:uncharacterized membrane protein